MITEEIGENLTAIMVPSGLILLTIIGGLAAYFDLRDKDKKCGTGVAWMLAAFVGIVPLMLFLSGCAVLVRSAIVALSEMWK